MRKLSKERPNFIIFCRMAQNIFLMKVLKELNFLQVGKKSIRRAESNFCLQKSEGVKLALEVSRAKNGVKRCGKHGLNTKFCELQ